MRRSGVGPGRGADPTATRRRILRAATRLYAAHGAEGVTVRAIGALANVSPPTIYWHFKSMSALVREVIDAAFEPLLARLQTIDPNAAPRARLQTATRMYKDFALANPREYHTMFMVPDRGRGLLRGSRISVGKQTFAILRGIVADCIEAGEIRGETPDSGALVIWGFVHGLVALQIAGRIGLDRDAFEVFFDRAYAVLFRGFGR